MAQNQYISAIQFKQILSDLNIESMDSIRQDDLLVRATGDLEADLSRKFVVPLVSSASGTYLTAPNFARAKALNAIRAKIRELVGYDKNREMNVAVDSTEKFINVFSVEYKEQIKTLLDPMIDFGFQLLAQAVDSQVPVQHIGLSRADNRIRPYHHDDDDGGFGGFGIY